VGINLVQVCERHKVYAYSIRGEEAVDIKAFSAIHHECANAGEVRLVYDWQTNADNEESPYTSEWEHELRPWEIGARAVIDRAKAAYGSSRV
jgi:hypothetical protein